MRDEDNKSERYDKELVKVSNYGDLLDALWLSLKGYQINSQLK
jgi:hypothetical protein